MMQEEIKISVIVPVYNAGCMICRMLDSLLCESFNDFEVIIVNDGSTDCTPDIIESYVNRDTRVRVFHKANEGVAMARQMGVDNARGEYSIHADVDDWVEPTMLEELYNRATAEEADVVIADYFVNTGDVETINSQQPSSLKPADVLRNMFENRLFGALWHKLIRTSLYTQYNLCFYKDINHCEDLLIWVQLLQHQNITIAYLPKAFYHYWVNPYSITHAFTRKTYETRLLFLEKLKELLFLPEFSEMPEKVEFDIFTEGFIYDVITTDEIIEGLKQHKKWIKRVSLKWRFGFALLSWGYPSLAHKLIHF